MELTLGILIGLVLSSLIFSILAFFRAGIEKRVKIIETVLGNAGPKPKGAIFMPIEESEKIRQERIEANRKLGKDTPISELQ